EYVSSAKATFEASKENSMQNNRIKEVEICFFVNEFIINPPSFDRNLNDKIITKCVIKVMFVI
ncbi:MAG: hypothetical protein IK047_05585, partial [Clostridia bacterium]|nr:hypothetical protein [Clostridia bacterium]